MPAIKYYAKKYIRLSHADNKKKSGKQNKSKENESDSVGNQRTIIDTFITQNPDIKDMGEQVDDGYSGIIFDRPAFKELMEEIHAGEINCVIVKDLSRLGREYIETGYYLRKIFPTLGVRFIAIGDGIDTAKGTSGDDMMVTVKSVINDAYCRDISTKTRSSLSSKRENGEYVANYTVYGYRKSEEDKNRLVIDEYPASIVREIYSMKIDGFSASAIAEELNKRGVLSPLEYKKDHGLPHATGGFADTPGAKWAATTVIRILKNETYTGTLVQGRQGTPSYKIREMMYKPEFEWVRVENTHDAIIAKEDFLLVQYLSVLDTRSVSGAKKAHLFSGILVCGCCGGRMTRKTVPYKDLQYHYWYCPTGKKKGCKNPVMLKEDLLSECVLENLKAHVSNVASLDSLLSAAMTGRAQSKMARQYKAHIEEQNRLLEKASANKAGLHAYLVDGILSKEDYQELKQGYGKDIQNAKSALNIANAALSEVLSGKDERLRWMERFRQFEGLSELNRRTVVYLIRCIRVVNKDELEITFNYHQDYEKALARLTAKSHRKPYEDKGVA